MCVFVTHYTAVVTVVENKWWNQIITFPFHFTFQEKKILKTEIFSHCSEQRLSLLHFKIYSWVLRRKKTVHFFLMCSPGVLHIHKIEMAEFGKIYLNLEWVSTEVLGLLYSYTDCWKIFLFFTFFVHSLVQSNPVHPLHCWMLKGEISSYTILWWASTFNLLKLLICKVGVSAIAVFWIVPLEWPLFVSALGLPE